MFSYRENMLQHPLKQNQRILKGVPTYDMFAAHKGAIIFHLPHTVLFRCPALAWCT